MHSPIHNVQQKQGALNEQQQQQQGGGKSIPAAKGHPQEGSRMIKQQNEEKGRAGGREPDLLGRVFLGAADFFGGCRMGRSRQNTAGGNADGNGWILGWLDLGWLKEMLDG
jgi:hypothetical protein